MILYMTTQDHTDLLDFYIEREGTLPVKKMTGSFILKQFVIYDMRNFSHCTELILIEGRSETVTMHLCKR